PLLGIHVTSMVRGSESTPRCLIADGIVISPVYCFALARQRRSTNIIWQLAGAPL
ncbi:hypothetical protein HAX54_029672, partial [Datura stramonium]|nr:hypothetical protein [Datura stramonium]